MCDYVLFFLFGAFYYNLARTPPKKTEPFPAPLDHSFSESVLEKPGPTVKIVTPVIDRVSLPNIYVKLSFLERAKFKKLFFFRQGS